MKFKIINIKLEIEDDFGKRRFITNNSIDYDNKKITINSELLFPDKSLLKNIDINLVEIDSKAKVKEILKDLEVIRKFKAEIVK